MCFQFRPQPEEPLPDFDALCDELIDFAAAWAGVHLHGEVSVGEARAKVRMETERLRCVESMKRQGL